MIQAAEQVAREGVGDPWPNCLDPYDGSGASWQRTKNCESPGYAWSADPPGYDCGPLQLDPILWRHVIRRWGVLLMSKPPPIFSLRFWRLLALILREPIRW